MKYLYAFKMSGTRQGVNIRKQRAADTISGIFTVDDDTYELLKDKHWNVTNGGYAFFAQRDPVAKRPFNHYLHRIVVGLEYGDKRQVEHLNGDVTDCRRENLRIVTASENGLLRSFRRSFTKHCQLHGIELDEADVRSCVDLKLKALRIAA